MEFAENNLDSQVALQFHRGSPSQSAGHAGDDQVGALDIRAAVCVVRGDAGG